LYLYLTITTSIHYLQSVVRSVSWKSPFSVSLNVDGSVFTNSSLIGFGSLIRDHESYFLLGFYGNIDPLVSDMPRF